MKRHGNILVVDDNRNILVSVRILLSDVFRNVTTLSSPAGILAAIRENAIDVVLLDMNFMSGINNGNEGLFWLKEINRHFPDVPVVLFTAYADIELAVRAMKEGAFNFVEKPWDNGKLIDMLRCALEFRTTRTKPADTTVADDGGESPMFWGSSPAMMQLRALTEKVALTDANVLITGENGTGKDVLAREIHRLSRRARTKMVSVDMGAISESLFESELFGHVRGAFTDARTDRTGYIEEADGGTLFLDEIGNLPLRCQSKLLNVLQSRCVTRVGSSRPVKVDIRLVSATNRNLRQMIADGTFREDLLYRINTIHLELPPLRERKEDIVPLARRFLAGYARRYDRPAVPELSENAIRALTAYAWKGNIRELQHVIEKAVIIASGNTITREDLQVDPTPTNDSQTAETLEDMEKAMIRNAIVKYGGNLSLVASRLGITRQTLYNKIKRYDISLL